MRPPYPHSCDRKINEFVKRVRACKIHMLLVGHMRNKMPAMFGAGKAQSKLLENITDVFTQVSQQDHCLRWALDECQDWAIC